MKNMQLTIKEKIEKIGNSENFEDLKTGWFPQSASTSYYFVSYCHKDYKKVFIDILEMQQFDSEIAVWYDRELNVGRDWEKEAKTHIYDFDCLGVLFYISENSVESPAIFSEMQMAMDAKKPFIPIVLPVENIRGKENEYLSGAELLDILYPRLSEDNEKYKLYHEMFNKNILFFKNKDSAQDKTARIKKSFTRKPLLKVEYCDKYISDKIDGTITAINNIDVIDVNETDYLFFDKRNTPICIYKIGKYAFSNCKHLERIKLPRTLKIIDNYAFYNCKKLRTIELSDDSDLECINDNAFMNCESITSIPLPDGIRHIGDQAFSGCKSITSIFIPNSVENIGHGVFSGCSSLTKAVISDRATSSKSLSFIGRSRTLYIGNDAFSDCNNLVSIEISNSVTSIGNRSFFNCGNLCDIKLPDKLKSIGNDAFYHCHNLSSIEIPFGVTSIGENAFAGCKNLKNIDIPYTVERIGHWAFSGCDNITSILILNNKTKFIGDDAFACKSLVNIEFNGTIQEWKSIHKGGIIDRGPWCDDEDSDSEYDNYLGICHEVPVNCTDGVIIIGKCID